MDHAIYGLPVSCRPSSQGIGRSWSSYTDPQRGFQILTPSGLEVQIFVDPKEAKNVPAELKERMDEEVQDKENML